VSVLYEPSYFNTVVFKQLFGRAGRAGMPSLAHLFYSPKKLYYKEMKDFIRSGICRRKVLIGSIGGAVETTQSGCCDTCSVHPNSSRLNIFSVSIERRRRHRRVVRSVDQDDLEKKLVTAREEFLKGHPSFRMIGVEFICPPIHHQKICRSKVY
jgi:superfamily II DNA helicase RecQ